MGGGEGVAVKGSSSFVRDERATDEDVVDSEGRWFGVCGMRTQTTHHPRLVLLVRSSSCGLGRVSVYVERRRWCIARLSRRDQGWKAGEGDVDGEGERAGDWGCWGDWGMLRAGMFGIDERIVRFDGS